jgi:hypothetical protein
MVFPRYSCGLLDFICIVQHAKPNTIVCSMVKISSWIKYKVIHLGYEINYWKDLFFFFFFFWFVHLLIHGGEFTGRCDQSTEKSAYRYSPGSACRYFTGYFLMECRLGFLLVDEEDINLKADSETMIGVDGISLSLYRSTASLKKNPPRNNYRSAQCSVVGEILPRGLLAGWLGDFGVVLSCEFICRVE